MKTTMNISKDRLQHYLGLLRHYSPALLALFLISIYGFLSWRIVQLMQVRPDPAAVSAELETVGIPKVDAQVVQKMEQLEDNSASVQTLFDEARRNPFQE